MPGCALDAACAPRSGGRSIQARSARRTSSAARRSQAQPGAESHQVDFDGIRYRFSSAQNKAAFSADPDRYLPQFGGYCAMGINKGKKFESDPTMWKVIDSKLYVFSSPAASEAASKDPEILARAGQQGQSMK